MSKQRLIELYPLGITVEVLFNEEWQPGVVIAHAHPAVWVQLQAGARLFITNRRHIRKYSHDER